MISLIQAELKRRWSLVKAYPVEELVETVMLAVFFYLIFLGAKYMAGPTASFGDRLDSIVVGYTVWLLMISTYSGIAYGLYDESKSGTVKQLMMSPYQLSHIFIARTIASTTFSVLVVSAVAGITMFLTGARLHLSPLMALPFLSVIMGSLGLGFILGGMVFVVKQVRSIQMVVQFALLFGVMVPIETWDTASGIAGSFLPISPGAASLRLLLVNQEFSLLFNSLAILNGLLYMGIGIFFFKKMENRARRLGMVGHY